MKNYDKLIFVGRSNTALSLMAEAILQKAFELQDILIESRGLVVLFPEPVNPKAQAVMVSHGLTMEGHQSLGLRKEDFDVRTLIIAMNSQLEEQIIKQFDEAQNVYSLCEYLGTEEVIEDPYGGQLSDYGRCFNQLQKLVGALGDKLIEEDR